MPQAAGVEQGPRADDARRWEPSTLEGHQTHDIHRVGGHQKNAGKSRFGQSIDAIADDLGAVRCHGQPIFGAVSSRACGEDRDACRSGVGIAPGPDARRASQRIGVAKIRGLGLRQRLIGIDQNDLPEQCAQHQRERRGGTDMPGSDHRHSVTHDHRHAMITVSSGRRAENGRVGP